MKQRTTKIENVFKNKSAFKNVAIMYPKMAF